LEERVPARLSAQEGRKFGLTVGIAFLVLAALSRWRGHELVPYVLGGVGLALASAAVLVPAHLGPVQRAWMGLARAISRVTTPIFMGIVFFVIITPVGLLMRVLGRNPIRHKPVNHSYWMPRAKVRGTMANQF
jgi:hypothetical protein